MKSGGGKHANPYVCVSKSVLEQALGLTGKPELSSIFEVDQHKYYMDSQMDSWEDGGN